jgi:[NiFe] hydrogenase diaphorase moiety large subunit
MWRKTELPAVLDRAIREHGGGPHNALQVCRSVQRHFSCIEKAAIPLVAEALDTTPGHIYSLVTFYNFLHLTPRGEYDIYLSDSITDQMSGSGELAHRLCSALGVSPGVPRIDGRVTVTKTSCTGLCDQGPAGLVNERPLTRLSPQRIDQIVELIERGVPVEKWPADLFQVTNPIQHRDLLLTDTADPGNALRALADSSPEQLLAELERSGLNGRGGAGFSTATKWNLCRNTPSDVRYVVCNADEGEPGTFKDRVLLQDYADAVIEGMTLCARVIGAPKGFIYLRAEYPWLQPHLEMVLERRRAAGLLGDNILGHPGWDFDIELHMGAGAYICGEESALIESLEGKRGIPRNRPPYPVTSGYLNKPTVVNNVETLLAANSIAVHGGAWFARSGGGLGTKVHSVSGDCERPGVYEFPVSTTVGDIVAAAGGGDAQAVQIAGAAGELLLASEFHRATDLKTLTTGGSFIIFGPQRSLLDATVNFTGFFAEESCGFCAPCRSGTQLARAVVERMAAGNAFGRDRDAVNRLIEVVPTLSHCGLGASALKPLRWLRDKCPQDYAKLFNDEQRGVLHFDLEQELSEINSITSDGMGRDA